MLPGTLSTCKCLSVSSPAAKPIRKDKKAWAEIILNYFFKRKKKPKFRGPL